MSMLFLTVRRRYHGSRTWWPWSEPTLKKAQHFLPCVARRMSLSRTPCSAPSPAKGSPDRWSRTLCSAPSPADDPRWGSGQWSPTLCSAQSHRGSGLSTRCSNRTHSLEASARGRSSQTVCSGFECRGTLSRWTFSPLGRRTPSSSVVQRTQGAHFHDFPEITLSKMPSFHFPLLTALQILSWIVFCS